MNHLPLVETPCAFRWATAALIAVTAAASPSALASVVDCTYDAAGRLVEMRYDSLTNLVHHYDSSGGIRQIAAYTSGTADLAVHVGFIPAEPVAGAPFKIRIVAANLSGVAANQVRVESDLPVAYDLVSATASTGTPLFSDHKVTWDLGALRPGGSALLEALVRAKDIGVAAITTQVFGPGDANPVNDSAARTVAISAPPELTLQWAESGTTELEIAWPGVVSGLILEEASSLSPPMDWKALDTASFDGGIHRIVIGIDSRQRFFRLRLGD